jgi:hypothetical protein
MANALVIGSTVIRTDARITQENFILANIVFPLTGFSDAGLKSQAWLYLHT